jgi:predicted nucleotidyltransferase
VATIPRSVERSIRQFLEAVSERYRVQAAYLYGSQARGTATFWSDIDLAIVSPDFSDDLHEERLALMRLAARIDDRIEPQPFTVEKFTENDPLASEVRCHGVRVWRCEGPAPFEEFGQEEKGVKARKGGSG